MPKKSKKLVHILGEVEVPFGVGKAAVIESCGGDKPGSVEFVVPAKCGAPIPKGTKMAYFREHDDKHYECEVVDVEELANGNGPPQVANMSYRRGWDMAFGKQPN